MAKPKEVTIPQPHFNRRDLILKKHPEIKNLYGYDSSQQFMVYICIFFQFLISYLLYRFDISYSSIFILSWVIGGFLHHCLAMAMHECSHDLIMKTKNGNLAFAILCNFPVIMPSAISFIRGHSTHHFNMGIYEIDNDLPTKWEIEFIKNSKFRKFLWLTFYFLFATCLRGFLKTPTTLEVINITIQMIVNILIHHFLGWKAIFYLMMSTLWTMSLHPTAGHYIHEHYSWTDDNQETYSYYGSLNFLSFNVGYHNEHHDFPKVPGSKLPQLHEIGKEYYKKLESHDSWTYIMLRFIFDDSLSHDSRVLRKENY